MKQILTVSALILCLLLSVNLITPFSSSEIPKTWDMEAIDKALVPFANKNASVTPVSEEFYYQLPEMKIYKSYPILILDSASNKRYIDSLLTLEPVEYFKEGQQYSQDELIDLGEIVFDAPIGMRPYSEGFIKELQWYIKEAGIPVTQNNEYPYLKYVLNDEGQLMIGGFSCGMCHTRVMKNGMVIKGAQGSFPMDRRDGLQIQKLLEGKTPEEKIAIESNLRRGRKALFYTPWKTQSPEIPLDSIKAEEIIAYLNSIPPGVLLRHGTKFDYPSNIPDLIGIKDRRYMDNTGMMVHNNIGDIMRYAAFNQNVDMQNDYNGFIPAGKQFKERYPVGEANFIGNDRRYSELQLYALALYLYAIEPPENPNHFDEQVLARGEHVFKREGCVTCHTPPLYTNNMLTPVDGFTPPREHLEKYDIFDISVGTDPGLALYTRRGTGYYKVPSLKGLWYRSPYGHSGQIATLEEWLDPARLEDAYVPSGFKPPFVTNMAVKGHEFGLYMPDEDKKALITFLKSL